MAKKEVIEHIIYSLELAQSHREAGMKLPPFLTPEDHATILAYWKNLLESAILEEPEESHVPKV